jgi:hypothetical protein
MTSYGESRRVDYTQAIILKIPYIPTYLHSYIPIFLPFAISILALRHFDQNAQGVKTRKKLFQKILSPFKTTIYRKPPPSPFRHIDHSAQV